MYPEVYKALILFHRKKIVTNMLLVLSITFPYNFEATKLLHNRTEEHTYSIPLYDNNWMRKQFFLFRITYVISSYPQLQLFTGSLLVLTSRVNAVYRSKVFSFNRRHRLRISALIEIHYYKQLPASYTRLYTCCMTCVHYVSTTVQ